MPISRLLQGHMREILGLEDEAARNLLSLYREAAVEITLRLTDLDQAGRGGTFTAQHLVLIGAQMRDALRTMGQSLTQSLSSTYRTALRTGGRQQIAEIADLERRFGDGGQGRLARLPLAERVARIQPIIPAAQVALLLEPQGLLVNRFRDGVSIAVNRELAKSMAMGEGIGQAARRLATVMEGERYQLERLARTEINNAANAGHHHAQTAVIEQLPEVGLKKQWSAHLDHRTSARCRGLHLQVREVNQEFVARDGWRGLYPPSHPNCRSRVLPYSERWEDASRRRKTEREIVGGDLNPERRSRPTRSARRAAAASNEARGFGPAFSGPGSPRPPEGPEPGTFEFSDEDRSAALAVIDQIGVRGLMTRANATFEFHPRSVVTPKGDLVDGMTIGEKVQVTTYWPPETYGHGFQPGKIDEMTKSARTRHEAVTMTLLHEVGHVIINRGGLVPPKLVKDAFKARADRQITRYAKTSEAEYFCESLVAYVYQQGALSRYDENAHRMVERVLDTVRDR